jgi:hypothetical protein
MDLGETSVECGPTLLAQTGNDFQMDSSKVHFSIQNSAIEFLAWTFFTICNLYLTTTSSGLDNFRGCQHCPIHINWINILAKEVVRAKDLAITLGEIPLSPFLCQFHNEISTTSQN